MTTFTELYAQEFEWEATKTRKILEAVPDHDPEYRPHEKSMTLMRLAGHIAHLPSWPAIVIGEDTTEMSVVSRGVPTLEKGGRAALLASFEQSVAATRAALATTNDEHLAKNWKFTANGRTVLDLPRTVVLSDVCRNHLIHHRGQLTVYIRLLGGTVPGLYGPSADDKIAMGMPI